MRTTWIPASLLLLIIFCLVSATADGSSLIAEEEDTTSSYTCSDYHNKPEFRATCCTAGSSIACQEIHYVLLAVSGTLEEGFELRPNLDYRPHGNSNLGRVNATFLGKALVRGYKSFLDIKNPTWREYKSVDGMLKTVNPAVLPTGCDEHANRYSIYAVDSRQAMHALAGEPRFLSIAPDMGLVDLTSGDHFTWPSIKALSAAYSRDLALSGIEHPDPNRIAFLTVTSTWFKSTFVENGIIYEDAENSITDYPESTGLWSKHILNQRGMHARFPQGCGSDPTGGQIPGVESADDYKVCIDTAIRLQETKYTVNENGNHIGQYNSIESCPWRNESTTESRSCYFECRKPARYGTTSNMVRFNKVIEACDLEALMIDAGLVDDITGGPKFPLQGCSLGFPPQPSDPFPPRLVTSKKHGKKNVVSQWKQVTTNLLKASTIYTLVVGFFLGLLV